MSCVLWFCLFGLERWLGPSQVDDVDDVDMAISNEVFCTVPSLRGIEAEFCVWKIAASSSLSFRLLREWRAKHVLGWPKISFGFFWNILWKNLNKVSGQPVTTGGFWVSVWPHRIEEGTACYHDLARVGEQGRGHALPQAQFMLTNDAGKCFRTHPSSGTGLETIKCGWIVLNIITGMD